MREQRLCSYAIKLSVRNQEPSLAQCAPDVMQAVILCSKNNGVSTYGFSCNQKQCVQMSLTIFFSLLYSAEVIVVQTNLGELVGPL